MSKRKVIAKTLRKHQEVGSYFSMVENKYKLACKCGWVTGCTPEEYPLLDEKMVNHQARKIAKALRERKSKLCYSVPATPWVLRTI